MGIRGETIGNHGKSQQHPILRCFCFFVFVQKTKWFAPIPRVVEYRQRMGNLSSLLPDQAEEALDATRAAAEKAQHAAAEAWNTSDGLVSEKGTVGTVGRPYSS